MTDKKLWFQYCRLLNVNPYSLVIKNDSYYKKGFEEWKRLQKSYKYYNYCLVNS